MTQRSIGPMQTATHNAPCAHCAIVNPSLKLCSACGTVAYCGRTCQKAAWPTHAPACKALVHSTEKATADGRTAILYDRAFGGFLSLAQRRMFVAHGPGVLLATLSAPSTVFRNTVPSDPSRSRTISLRYVPDAAVPTLDATLAGASGAENLKAIEHASQMSSQLFPNVPGRYPGQMYVLVIRTAAHSESRYDAKVSIMMNWLSDTHPAHHAFSADLPLSDAQLIGAVFNWDTKEMILPRGCRMRTLPAEIVKTIISEDFYEECMRTHRRRKASLKKGEPLAEPSLCPPFAQSLSANQLFTS